MDRQPEVIDLTADDETDTASCSEQKSTRYDLRKHENTVAKQTSICADQVIESTNKARDDTREVNNLKYDDPSESSDSSDQSNEDEDLNTKPKAEENGLSAYEQLRLERIKRNIAKLESLGFSAKPNSHEKNRKSPSKPNPRRSFGMTKSRFSQRPSARTKMTQCKASPPVPTKKDLVLFEGQHDDDCFICEDGGDLVCCDYCCKAFHPQCHIPPLLEIPSGLWACCECKATQLTRAFRCGECDACTRPNCGHCTYCLDMKRFGGPNIKKQACIHKRCQNKRYAPPTRVTPERMQQIPSDTIFKGEHDDECFICYDGGELVCCDICPKAFHLQCHIPPLTKVPEGDWTCCECKATREIYYSKGQNAAKRARKRLSLDEEDSTVSSRSGDPSYDKDEYKFLWEYYLHKVKRSKEQLPGGMTLRFKSVQCNLLRYSRCEFRQKLFKEIHRLKQQKCDDEIYRMLKLLYEHDESGKSGDGPKELMEQILQGSGDDDDELEATNMDREMVVVDLEEESDGISSKVYNKRVVEENSDVAAVKVKTEPGI